MAVTAVATGMSGAINYTFTTDTSADFPSVANSTYFYNIADKLVRYKNSSGVILEIFSNGSASGVWGISDSTGVYTYYTTLTLAMVAAVSGQVIEMFADVTETGAVSITLKDGVNINGNGHTYYHTNATADLNTFIAASSVVTNSNILNINIVKSNSTGSCLYTGLNNSGTLIFTGSKLINLSTGRCISAFANSDLEIINVYAKSNTNHAIMMSGNFSRLTNSYAYSESGAGIVTSGTFITNCTGISNSNAGIYITSGRATDCVGFSSSSYGLSTTGGIINNCKGFSSASSGIYALYSNIYDCFGYSAAQYGIHMENQPTFASDCTGYSSASYGILSAYVGTKSLVNCTAIADAAIALYLYGEALNCTSICNWNNIAGHSVNLNGISTITNCTLKVANATANAIYSSAAVVVKYANNSYIGATTPVNANVTQGIINSQDNQGNILI
jgi:hypothetical protein